MHRPAARADLQLVGGADRARAARRAPRAPRLRAASAPRAAARRSPRRASSRCRGCCGVAMRGASRRSAAPSPVTSRSVQTRAVAVAALHQHGARVRGPAGARPCACISATRARLRLAEQTRGLGQVRGQQRRQRQEIPDERGERRGCSSTSPDFATMTGSRTTGAAATPSAAATAATMSGGEEHADLDAAMSISSRTASSWASTRSVATSSTAVTARVFCAVIAVMTVAP